MNNYDIYILINLTVIQFKKWIQTSNYLTWNFSHFLFKVLLIGNSGVGKSCMLMRYSVL